MTLAWFAENGCELHSPDPKLLLVIYTAQDGDPCTGCRCKDTCPAWPKVLMAQAMAMMARRTQ
jgi:hypothetical protein